MSTVRLEVSEAGIRPYGFYSRDRADEAVVELQALLVALSPDRRPVAVRWQRVGDDLVPRHLPLFRADRPTLFEWDADTGALSGEAAGAPIEAIAEQRGFRVTWGGRTLTRAGVAWVDDAGDRLGPEVHDRLVVAPIARLRHGRVVLPKLSLDGDVPLPAAAVVRARLVGAAELDVGEGKFDAEGRVTWSLPPRDRWPEGPWELAVDANVAVDGASLRVPAIEATAFTDAALLMSGRVVRQVLPGDAITALHFGCAADDATPPRVVLGFATTSGDLRVQCVGHGPVRDMTGVVYRLEPPVVVPVDLFVPGRVAITAEGQDAPVGTLVVAPRVVCARFRLVRDERGSARVPRIDAAHLEPVGMRAGRFAPAEDGTVQVEIDGVTCTAPLADDAFVPLLPTDPREPVWRAVTTAERGAVTAWAPGFPPVEVPVDEQGRMRPRSPAFEEMAREWARRGLALRLHQADRRGVVWPADASCGGEELLPAGGAFAVQAGHRYAIAFRGLVIDAALATSGDQSVLQAERPVPIDGRLGIDLAAFLPLRAQLLPHGVEVAAGSRRVRLVEQAGRLRAEAETAALLFESRWGFHAEHPREPTGRLAFHGLVFGRDASGVVFLGWLLDPTFFAPPCDPWPGYGFRAGPMVAGPVLVSAEGAAPGVPSEVLTAARAMIASSARAVRTMRCDEGDFELVPAFDDPRKAPVHVEVTTLASTGNPAVRVFRR